MIGVNCRKYWCLHALPVQFLLLSDRGRAFHQTIVGLSSQISFMFLGRLLSIFVNFKLEDQSFNLIVVHNI